eukprot:TRINITY_DN578_c0_g2_i4.p1 TRINITY_DN578_c0_g2~~TRINITY_DN578_c0_g2_i4.p1  ORF type:complete len:527 (-),score=128.36 TRINITY_DN578_c0_g2_i4:343-1923(-)
MEIESQNRHNDEAAIPMQEIKPSRNGQNADPYIALKYTDVNYSVSKRPKLCFGPKKVKQILKDLNGSFYEGELVALMGPSGAGKTTFLHVLSGQYMAGKLEGEIKIHGKTRTWKNKHKFRHHCAYVAQDDTLFSNLTTMETFTFASRLRLPREMSAAKKHERVMQVVDDLSLSRALPTFVGTPGVPGGVSGGERKRVSIGAEMIHDPNLVFLDEPTSGLDSWTARSVIQNLKFLTSTRNKTIVVTIHQPSTDVFNLFDKLVILARGDMIYNGRTDNVINYFAGIGYQCPTFVNPSEFIMDLVQPGFGVDPNQAREEKAVSRESHAKAEKISKEYVQTEDDIKTTERTISRHLRTAIARTMYRRNTVAPTKTALDAILLSGSAPSSRLLPTLPARTHRMALLSRDQPATKPRSTFFSRKISSMLNMTSTSTRRDPSASDGSSTCIQRTWSIMKRKPSSARSHITSSRRMEDPSKSFSPSSPTSTSASKIRIMAKLSIISRANTRTTSNRSPKSIESISQSETIFRAS